eukprot:TRINITY_DN1186_c0_g2_i1.p1 TRINITY_DN1186_c0_g2~~TRINITY_DN1186_c0_g2_i1.p1  ORF type:complete len:628 (+),score=183.77 TRINITY_DN1186_c0_g2_i1:24-1886(+)
MSLTLEAVLENDGQRETFRRFMKERFASEHIDCWCLVRKFKAEGLSEADKFEVASEIFEKYVKEDARHQITIDHPLRDAITRMVENNATIPKMFDTLQQVCFSTMKHSLFPEFIRSEGHKLLQRTVSPSESLRGQSAPSSENSSGGSRIGQKLEYLRVMVGDDRKTILCSRELNAADCKEHIIEKLCREHNGALTPELFAKESSLYKTHALFREVPALKAYVELFASDIVIVMESGSEQPSAVSMQPSTRLDFLSRRSELAKGLKDAEADVSAAIREMSEAMDSHASSALKKALREKVDAKSALVQSLSQQLLNFPSPLEKSGFLSMIKGDSINKYYFTLEDGAFKYYESPGDSMAMGTVGLVVNETAVLFSPNNNQTFVVQTGTARTVFMTSTPEERLEWMQALSGNCERAIGELDASEAIALKKTTASRLRKSKASRKNSLLIPARRSPSDKGIKKVTERNISINEPLLKGFQSERVIGQDAVFKDAGEGALTLQAGRYEDVCTILWLFHDTNTVSLDLQSWLLMYHNYCTPEQFIDAVATRYPLRHLQPSSSAFSFFGLLLQPSFSSSSLFNLLVVFVLASFWCAPIHAWLPSVWVHPRHRLLGLGAAQVVLTIPEP